MGDPGTMTETESELEQPTESVADEVEESGQPQSADNDSEEFEVEVEAEPESEPAKDDTDWRAVAKAKAVKMKKQREAREKAEREKRELEERLAKQEAMLRELTAKKRPKLEDYNYDEEAYASALLEWNHQAQAPKPQEAKTQQQSVQFDDGVLEDQLESAERMRSKLKSYDGSEEKLRAKIASAGADPDQVSYGIAEICSTYGIDYATSVIALAEVPGVFDSVAKDASNERAIARHLRKAADKVTLQPKRKIDTKPEPQVSGAGAVNSLQAEVDRAQKKYAETGKLDDYKALATAKKRLREGN